ncbi:MAG: hypothetical protein NTX92_08175, partial [Euryarchaeota archaeon]|nr:hypothetical protein [Euryarchaeota archaeon]
SNAGFYLKMYDNGAAGYNYVYLSDGTRNTYRYWNTAGTDGNWHYLTIVIDRNTNTLNVYLDGILHNGISAGSLANLGSITTTSNFNFYGGTNARHDEFTISTAVRNDSWIKTSYNSQNNPASFYQIYPEQPLPPLPPSVTNPQPIDEATNLPLHPTLRITVSHNYSYLMNIFWKTNASGTWTIIGTNSSVNNGIYSCSNTAWASQYHKKYWWKVEVNDGHAHWNNKTYVFTTLTLPPTQGTPLLISEYGTDTTYEDLICSNQSTVDPNGLAVYNTYHWLRNSNSLTNLLLSFNTENQTNVKDYSGYNNNGTITGATWTPNGIVGGAYYFSGVDSQDRISIPHSSTLDGGGAWTGMTIEHWIYLMDDQTNSRTISKMASSGNSRSYQIGFQSTNPNRLLAGVYIGNDNYKEVTYNTPLLTGQWYHVALTYQSGTGVKLYLNGVVVASVTGTENIQASAGNNLYLGCRNGTQQFFDGRIDEVKLYPYALTTEQIYQNYLESKDGLSTHSTIVPEETTVGDVWQCGVTPSNGVLDGLTKTSNPLTIVNSWYTLAVNNIGNGIVTKNPDYTTYPAETVVNLTAIPDTAWFFSHWSGDLTGSENPTTIIMNSNKAVTAHFTQNEYTLTLNTVGEGSIAKSPDQATYPYGTVVTLNATGSLGWSFSSWSGDLTGSVNPTTITIDGNKAVTATFTEDHYLLTTTINGQGTLVKNPDQPTYAYGIVVTLAATPTLGWTFVGWSDDLSGSTNPTTITMTSNKAVTATFTQNNYTLTVDHIGNGSVAKNPDQTTYRYNDPVTLTATADPSWSFTGWSGDLSGTNNPVTITIIGNMAITAHFSLIQGLENWRYR